MEEKSQEKSLENEFSNLIVESKVVTNSLIQQSLEGSKLSDLIC